MLLVKACMVCVALEPVTRRRWLCSLLSKGHKSKTRYKHMVGASS